MYRINTAIWIIRLNFINRMITAKFVYVILNTHSILRIEHTQIVTFCEGVTFSLMLALRDYIYIYIYICIYIYNIRYVTYINIYTHIYIYADSNLFRRGYFFSHACTERVSCTGTARQTTREVLTSISDEPLNSNNCICI
jgi:hypothetical protein